MDHMTPNQNFWLRLFNADQKNAVGCVPFKSGLVETVFAKSLAIIFHVKLL